MLFGGCVPAVLSLGQLSMLFGDCRCNVVGFVLNKRSLGSKILIALVSLGSKNYTVSGFKNTNSSGVSLVQKC
jgi:hypothetical protein